MGRLYVLKKHHFLITLQNLVMNMNVQIVQLNTEFAIHIILMIKYIKIDFFIFLGFMKLKKDIIQDFLVIMLGIQIFYYFN